MVSDSIAIYFSETTDSDIVIHAQNTQIKTAGITADDVYPKSENSNPQKRIYTMIAVMRGLFIEKLSGKDPQEIKNTWARIIFVIYTSKK